MTEWLIAKSVWVTWLKRPTTWILAGMALGFSRWLERWLPLGLTTEDLQRLSAHYEIAFLAGLAGASSTAATMRHYAAITRQLPPLRRVTLETAILGLPAALVALAVLVPAHQLRTWQMGSFDVGAAIVGLGIGWLHFCLMAGLALRVTQGGGGGRPMAESMVTMGILCLVVVAAPGLLDGYGRLADGLGWMLDVGAPLRASFASDAPQASFALGGLHLGSPHPWAWTLPIATFGLLSLALASPYTARQTPPYALRDPR